MKILRGPMKIAIGIILLTAGLFVYFLPGWLIVRMPTDEELTTRFFKERDSFDKLGRLLIDDTTLFLARPDSLNRLVGREVVSETPSDVYKSAFERTGILSGTSYGPPNLNFIKFPVYDVQLDGGDFDQTDYVEKGYALMLSPPENVQKILGRSYGNTTFKQIDGQWYIYHGIFVSKPE